MNIGIFIFSGMKINDQYEYTFTLIKIRFSEPFLDFKLCTQNAHKKLRAQKESANNN